MARREETGRGEVKGKGNLAGRNAASSSPLPPSLLEVTADELTEEGEKGVSRAFLTVRPPSSPPWLVSWSLVDFPCRRWAR